MFREQRSSGSSARLLAALLSLLACTNLSPAQEFAPAVDLYGDSLPPGAVARLGTVRYRHGGWQRSYQFLPGTRTLISTADGNSLCWWNAEDGKLLRRVQSEDSPFQTVALVPGGRALVSAGRLRWTDKGPGAPLLQLWDLETGKTLRTIPFEGKSAPGFLLVTPDGKTVLTAAERDNKVRILDVGSGEELLRFQVSSRSVSAMALSPTGDIVAVSEEQGDSIYLWEWQTANKPRRLAVNLERGANFLAFSPDGRLLIFSGDGRRGVCFLDVSKGTVVDESSVGDSSCRVSRAAFSHDGELLATALSYYESQPETRYTRNRSGVFLWHSPSSKLLRRIDTSALDLAVSADKKTLHVLNAAGPSQWDIATGKRLTAAPPPAPSGEADSLGFDRSGTLVMTGGGDGIRLWEARSGKHLRMIPTSEWTSAALCPDGKRIATAGHDNTVRLFDAGTTKEIFRLSGHGELGPRYQVAFFPDGARFASFGDNCFLRVWNAANGRALLEHALRPEGLELPDEDDFSPEAEKKRRMLDFRSMQAYFSANARVLILSTDATLHVIDVESGKERAKIASEDGSIYNLAVSPDGRWLVTSAWGRTLLSKDRASTIPPQHDFLTVYELPSGKVAHRIPLLRSSAGPVAFASDSRRFALAARDKAASVEIYDLSGKKTRTLGGLDGRVTRLAFSGDDRLLATALNNSTVLIWDLTR